MLSQFFRLGFGFALSTVITFFAISILSSNENLSVLSISVFTVFSSLGIFDFGISRTVLNLSARYRPNLSQVLNYYVTYIALITPVTYILLTTLSKLPFNPDLPLFYLSLQITVCCSINIVRSIGEASKSYIFVSILRLYQAICIALISFSLDSSHGFIPTLTTISLPVLIVCALYYSVYSKIIDKRIGLADLGTRNYGQARLFLWNGASKGVYYNTLFSTCLIAASNLGDRYIASSVLSVQDASAYLALQEILSKALAVATLFSTMLFGEIANNTSEMDVNTKEIRRTFLYYLYRQSVAVGLTTLVLIIYIFRFASPISNLFGIASIFLIAIGIHLNSIAGLISTTFEALGFFRTRSATICIFITISLCTLYLFLLRLPFPWSLSFFWVVKGVTEVAILLVTSWTLYRRGKRLHPIL